MKITNIMAVDILSNNTCVLDIQFDREVDSLFADLFQDEIKKEFNFCWPEIISACTTPGKSCNITVLVSVADIDSSLFVYLCNKTKIVAQKYPEKKKELDKKNIESNAILDKLNTICASFKYDKN